MSRRLHVQPANAGTLTIGIIARRCDDFQRHVARALHGPQNLLTPTRVCVARNLALELSMSSSEEVINNMTDNAIYEPLQKDVEAVKNAISALTNQVSDALNTFAGTAEKQARRGYKQARSNVDAAVSDFTKRGGAALDAAHEAANTLEESLEDAIQQRPLATIGLAIGLGFLIGVTWRR